LGGSLSLDSAEMSRVLILKQKAGATGISFLLKIMTDWSSFTKRIPINAFVEDIYEAWATRGGIESWFLRLAEFSNIHDELRRSVEFVESGDKYLWAWHGWNDEANQTGEILEANGVDFFKFTFHAPMTVTVKIIRENETNLLELTQENIPPDEVSRKNYFVGCGEGWTFYLANLKSVLEGGLDLRNRDGKLKNVINS
jgi:hypothetical protein